MGKGFRGKRYYSKMTVPELKKILKEKGLPVGGLKGELVERLVDPAWELRQQTPWSERPEGKRQQQKRLAKKKKERNNFIVVGTMLFVIGIFQLGLLLTATLLLALGLLLGLLLYGGYLTELDWLVDDSGALRARWWVGGLYFSMFLFSFWLNYDLANVYDQFDLYDVDSIFISTVLYQTVFTGTLIVIAFLVLGGAMSLLEAFEGEPSNSDEKSFTLLYIASFLIPIAGIIIGAIYLTNEDEETRNAGNTCLLLGIIAIILGMAFYLLLVASLFA